MWIARIAVDGFGWLRDRQWEPGAGLTLVRGVNEAGKSTLLAFIRAILFGFDRSDPPALAGGRRGGRLDLVLAGGRTVTVERHGERSGEGTLEVRDGDGPVAETLGELLRGVDRTVFRNVFAFGLGELSNLATLTDAGVASRIYGAGAGSGTADALGLEDELTRERSSLFRQGGRVPALNVILDEIDGAEARLRAHDLPAEYGSRRTRLEALERELRELDGRERELGARRGRLERMAAAWEPWTRRLAAATRLEAIPDPGCVPPDAEVRGAVLAAAVGQAEESVAALARRHEALEGQLALLRPDRTLLGATGRIEAMSNAAAEDRARLEELGRAEADLGSARALEAQAISALGAGWTPDRVASFDASVAVRAAIAGPFRDALEAATREVRRREDAVAAAAHDRGAVTAELRDLDEEIAALGEHESGDGERAARLDEVAACRRELDLLRGLEPAVAPPPVRGARPDALVGRVAVALVLLAGGVVATSVAALGWPLLGGVAALGTAAAAVVTWHAVPPAFRRLAGRPQAPVADPVPAALRASEARLRDRLAAAGLSPDAGDAEIAAARTAADADRDTAGRRAALCERRGWLARRLDALLAASATATGALEVAQRQHDSVEADWRSWLAAHGLDHGLGREEAGLLVDAIGVAQGRLEASAAAARRVAALRSAHAAHGAAVDALLRDLDRPCPSPGDDAARGVALTALLTALRAAVRASEDADRLGRELEAVERDARDAAQRLTAATDARARFHGSCSVHDDEELAVRAAAAAERIRLHDSIEALTSTLVTLSGPGDALDRLEADLRAVTDVAEVTAALATTTAELADLARRRDAAREEAGALRQTLEEMETSAADTEVRQAREDLRARGTDLADRWAVLTVARALLRRTREQYEREHRPDVVRDAERMFAAWTDGRYPSIAAPLAGGMQAAVRWDGSLVRLPELSRGTAEQLYLAMRIGLAEHFAATADALPLVMDDVLVNFDPGRAEHAARTIEEVAARHQVLYFTCHPATPLRAERVIELERIGAEPATAAPR